MSRGSFPASRVSFLGEYFTMAENGSQMAERLGNRAINQKVTGLIPGRK